MASASRLTAASPSEGLARDAEVLRSVLGRLRDPAARAIVQDVIDGFTHGGVVVARGGDLVSPREAGVLLGVSRQFVDKLIAEGRLPAATKPGSRHRVVRVADVVAFEAQRRAGGARIAATVDELVAAGAQY